MTGFARRIYIKPKELIEDEPVTTAMNRPIHFVLGAASDPTSEQRMRIVEVSGTLDFWDRPEEGIYSLSDGDPA